MKLFLRFLIVLSCFCACTSKSKSTIDVSKVSVNFSLNRFEIDFYTSTKETLPAVKKKYPFFFPDEMSDSIALSKINDPDEQELYQETIKVYCDFSKIEDQLTTLFQHVAYYNSYFKAPKVVTMLTNIDYDNRVIYADSLLLVSLDVFLGDKHPFYNDYPAYIKQHNTPEYLIVNVAEEIVSKQLRPINTRRFLDKLIFEGKKIYLLERYLPVLTSQEIFGTSNDKYEWLLANEEQIWSYFIEREFLFSTDSSLNSRFIETAPFSKFYMEHDALSPGRVGVWVGWQIVRSFMEHNNVSLQQLLEISETDLYSKSNYKPRK